MRQKMLPQCNCFMMHFKLGSDRGGRCIRYLQNRCPGPDWSQSWCLADLLGPVRSIQQEIFYLAMLDFILYALHSHTCGLFVWLFWLYGSYWLCFPKFNVFIVVLANLHLLPGFSIFYLMIKGKGLKEIKQMPSWPQPSTLWLIIVFLRWSIVNVFINVFTDIQLYQQIYVDI